jgi:D-alanyl-D-alanine-carboxypeptidase/D-alanyl-D-alanine-endopeptidase
MHEILIQRRRAAQLLLALPLAGLWAAPRARAAADAVADVAANAAVAVNAAAAVFMADPRAVGLSVGVIEAGNLHSHHFGSVSKRREQRANDRTLYPIASLTKTFTGGLLAQAQRDGKLKLDDDIRTYLDGDYPNLAFGDTPIRLYHLLNHRSGLPRTLPPMPEAEPDFPSKVPYAQRMNAAQAKVTRADFYAALHKVVLTAAPGTKFSYSNAAAQLAGFILERIYAAPFDALVRRFITAPLGMPDTVVRPTPEQAQRLADGYENAVLQPPMQETAHAAGALKSTMADMLAYARWQLAEQDPVVRLSHQPTYRNNEYAVGLNWQIVVRDKRRVIFQDGSIPGYACLLVLHPESAIAIVLLSNEIDRDTALRLVTVANSITLAIDKAAVLLPLD